MKKKQFVVIAGIDGSGKTTLIEALAKKESSWEFTNWKKFEKVIDKSFDPVGTSTPAFIEGLSPFTRSALFLYNFGLQLDKIIHPILETGGTIISDSYWYKFTAKMYVTGHGDKGLLSSCGLLLKPDKIIFLDTAPEIAFQRKMSFNFYESFGDRDNFVNFQTEVRQQILNFIPSDKIVLRLTDDMDFSSKVAATTEFIQG